MSDLQISSMVISLCMGCQVQPALCGWDASGLGFLEDFQDLQETRPLLYQKPCMKFQTVLYTWNMVLDKIEDFELPGAL